MPRLRPPWYTSRSGSNVRTSIASDSDLSFFLRVSTPTFLSVLCSQHVWTGSRGDASTCRWWGFAQETKTVLPEGEFPKETRGEEENV